MQSATREYRVRQRDLAKGYVKSAYLNGEHTQLSTGLLGGLRYWAMFQWAVSTQWVQRFNL